MYNSHPSDVAYGGPGFFVDNPSGRVRDSAGRSVDLRPDFAERNTRRILVRTSELRRDANGVYVAKIRRAKNVSAIKLTYASIPRPVSRVIAQLILYSIPIKRDSTDYHKIALQRMCRSQLLSSNTSDVPFFRVSENDFDWRNTTSSSAWINSSDRNTFIPPQLESGISNQYVDIDVLTVKVPSMCSLHSLGNAFQNALKSHSGAENLRNNSLWTKFDLSVEETGFSVYENINDSDVFTTFAAIASPYVTPNDGDVIRQNQSAVNSFIPMGTPLYIKMKKSKSVFVSNDTLSGASTAPANISPSVSSMTEFAPKASSASENTTVFTTEILTPNRFVYSFSCFGDMSADDILEVVYNPLIELRVTSLPNGTTASGGTITSTKFGVRLYYGSVPTASTGIPIFLRTDANTQIEFTGDLDTDGNFITITNGTFDINTGVLTKTGTTEKQAVPVGSSFFHMVSTAGASTGPVTSIDVSEVKRTYQKTRDVRLGLRWGNNKENEDFFIDTNHSLDSPVITNDPSIQTINPNYDFVGQHRRDVALLSQYSKKVTATQTIAVDTSDTLTLTNKQPPNASIIPGMIVTTSNANAMTPTNTTTNVQVTSVSTTTNPITVTLSQNITVAINAEFTFQVAPENNSTYHNMLRNTGDLEDTYIEPTNNMSEIFNVHEVNDAHQIQRMLFSGHMMNVSEPAAMPVSTNADPEATTGQRPTLDQSPNLHTATSSFYQEGLGWETSIVHAPTRFIMPAFPVRFTEVNDYTHSSDASSIYSTTSVSAETSVSPLVSRILNVTSVTRSGETDPRTVGYYQLNRQLEDGTVDSTFDEVNGKTLDPTSPSPPTIDGMSYYTPRTENTCGIVVTIGKENYVVKSARLISVLRNETQYTLNLNCDRNYNSYNSSPQHLSSIKNLESIRNALRHKGYGSEKERADLQSRIQTIENELQNAFHSFYAKSGTGYEVNANAKYFSWVFELDRPVELSTGISSAHGNPYRTGDMSVNNPPVTERSFNGMVDSATLFTPGIYERNTGRSAVTTIQQCAHSFSVRSGSQESENSLLVLHGIGSLERPLNSTHSTDPGDVFAVMGAEHDQKKPEKMVCDNTTFLRSPDNLESLTFHFMNSKTGEKTDIGNQNATLIFDIYCSNE